MARCKTYHAQKWNICKESRNDEESEQWSDSKNPNKHGLTRETQKKGSIKQWGVLSIIEYATPMDEITK